MRTRLEGVLELSGATPEPLTPPASGAAKAAERPLLSPQFLDVLGSESEVRSIMSGVAFFFALCAGAPFSAPEFAKEVSLGEDPKKVFSDD